MSRYEIRVYPPSDVALSYGITDDLYVVWDTKLNKRVPYGNYHKREQAEARVKRMENKA